MPTIAQHVADIRVRTDTVGDAHFTDAWIGSTFARHCARLHGKLTTKFQDYSVTTATLTVLAGATGWTLPTGFHKHLRVEKLENGILYPLHRIPVRDEPLWTSNTTAERPQGYVIYDTALRLVPRTNVAGTYYHLYYPTWTVPVATADVVIGPPGQQWEEWAVLKTAIDVAEIDEMDTSSFRTSLAILDAELDGEMDERDIGESCPPPIQLEGDRWYDRIAR